MSNLSRAIELATYAHSGQFRRDGKTPYIVHPLRVMLVALEIDRDYATVAILHDTLEDTELTVADLKREGFSEDIIMAVRLLTNTFEVSYDNYLAALKANKMARLVKIADIEDNLSDQPSDKQREKYSKALAFLKS